MFDVSLESEFSGCDFGDVRLTNRLPLIGKKLGERPSLSIPASLESRAETEAAYRFFDNEHVTPEQILATRQSRTLERITQSKVCLLVQDTIAVYLVAAWRTHLLVHLGREVPDMDCNVLWIGMQRMPNFAIAFPFLCQAFLCQPLVRGRPI